MRHVPCPSYIFFDFTLKVNLIALLNLWYAGESSHNLLSVHWIWILRIGAKGLKVWFIWYVYLSFPIKLCWYISHLKAKVVADNSLEIKSAKNYIFWFLLRKKIRWDLYHLILPNCKIVQLRPISLPPWYLKGDTSYHLILLFY